MKTQVEHMPAWMRLLNTFYHLLQPDGVMRQLSIERLWYMPGCLWAARFLFETVRWEWRNRGNIIQVALDSNDPLLQVFSLFPWDPKLELGVAVRGPVPITEGKLICPV